MNASKNITFFTTCKPFQGEAAILQENALMSWKRLGVPIIICGDEAGAKEMANKIGAQHIADINRNEQGTPYIKSIFSAAEKASKTPFLAYLNADIIVRQDVLKAMEAISKNFASQDPFLMTCRRRNIPLGFLLPGKENDCSATLSSLDQNYGSFDQSNAIDLFFFRRGLFDDIIPLVIGHMQWDNWLLWYAKYKGASIIDASWDAVLLHPIHGYYSDGSGLQQRSQGKEAAHNRLVAAGNSIDLNTATTHLLMNGDCHARTEQNYKRLRALCKPDPDKELRASLKSLSETIRDRNEGELLDCCRTVLWRLGQFFPFLENSTLTHSHVSEGITSSLTLLDKNDPSAALNILQDLVCDTFLKRVRLKQELGRPIYIRGSGLAGQHMLTFLKRHLVKVAAFLDEDKKKAGTIIHGVPVMNHPREGYPGPSPYIVIASMYMAEITTAYAAQNLQFHEDYTG